MTFLPATLAHVCFQSGVRLFFFCSKTYFVTVFENVALNFKVLQLLKYFLIFLFIFFSDRKFLNTNKKVHNTVFRFNIRFCKAKNTVGLYCWYINMHSMYQYNTILQYTFIYKNIYYCYINNIRSAYWYIVFSAYFFRLEY